MQLDLEISFADEETVMHLVENVVIELWREFLNRKYDRFIRMTYDEAIRRYGSDKPDLRFGLEVRGLLSPHYIVLTTQDTRRHKARHTGNASSL
jgi:aspartyl-tRNA synthetase